MKNYMLSVGSEFPEFDKKAVASIEQGKEFSTVNSHEHRSNGKWMVMFWWPKDFTFVCPTEIAEFNKAYADFTDRDAVLIGASTDSEFVHLAWRNNHPDLKDLKFPMLADTSKSLAEECIIRWTCVNDLSVGRNVPEVLRVLDALQTDELCPCNWKKGEETIK
jgi:peroxiredoxin (alkyl hydroperoxide reductase subunit C)